MSGAPLPSSFDGNTDFYEENRWQKFTRRLKEEPLIPFGTALTCYALYQAGASIRNGDSVRANRMFRNRIYAQGFTLLAMLAGSTYYQKDRAKRKEFEGVVAEKKAKEKNEAWIRELEARDREDKEWRVRMGKVTAADKAAAEKEKEKDAGSEKSGGVLAAMKEFTPVDTSNSDVGENEEQRSGGSGKGGGILSIVKKELVGTEKGKKDK